MADVLVESVVMIRELHVNMKAATKLSATSIVKSSEITRVRSLMSGVEIRAMELLLLQDSSTHT
eukprot:6181438-Amphidinium_carterae.1